MTPAKFRFGHDRKKQIVKRAANIDAIMQNLIVPEQQSFSFFTKYPPRKVPPPPAGTVIKPVEEKKFRECLNN